MPFKSKAQWRAAFAGKIKGISKEKAKEWADETTRSFKSLPNQVAPDAARAAHREREKKSEFDQLVEMCTKLAINIPRPATRMALLPAKSQSTGMFRGKATANFLKPPGGSMAKTVITPGKSLGNAMRNGTG